MPKRDRNATHSHIRIPTNLIDTSKGSRGTEDALQNLHKSHVNVNEAIALHLQLMREQVVTEGHDGRKTTRSGVLTGFANSESKRVYIPKTFLQGICANNAGGTALASIAILAQSDFTKDEIKRRFPLKDGVLPSTRSRKTPNFSLEELQDRWAANIVAARDERPDLTITSQVAERSSARLGRGDQASPPEMQQTVEYSQQGQVSSMGYPVQQRSIGPAHEVGRVGSMMDEQGVPYGEPPRAPQRYTLGYEAPTLSPYHTPSVTTAKPLYTTATMIQSIAAMDLGPGQQPGQQGVSGSRNPESVPQGSAYKQESDPSASLTTAQACVRSLKIIKDASKKHTHPRNRLEDMEIEDQRIFLINHLRSYGLSDLEEPAQELYEDVKKLIENKTKATKDLWKSFMTTARKEDAEDFGHRSRGAGTSYDNPAPAPVAYPQPQQPQGYSAPSPRDEAATPRSMEDWVGEEYRDGDGVLYREIHTLHHGGLTSRLVAGEASPPAEQQPPGRPPTSAEAQERYPNIYEPSAVASSTAPTQYTAREVMYDPATRELVGAGPSNPAQTEYAQEPRPSGTQPPLQRPLYRNYTVQESGRTRTAYMNRDGQTWYTDLLAAADVTRQPGASQGPHHSSHTSNNRGRGGRHKS
jgi:hypothetical protein